jgi:hypothetical protein
VGYILGMFDIGLPELLIVLAVAVVAVLAWRFLVRH